MMLLGAIQSVAFRLSLLHDCGLSLGGRNVVESSSLRFKSELLPDDHGHRIVGMRGRNGCKKVW